MGEHDVEKDLEPAQLRRFSQALLNDLQVLERMLRDGRVETGVRRIGAEQEVFLVDQRWRPAPVATVLLDCLQESCFTTELARFNLEINLEPAKLEGQCFSALEAQLRERVGSLRSAARSLGAEVVLTGILPTLVEADPLAQVDEAGRGDFSRIRQLMTTDLFTLHPDQVIDLAPHLMDWQQIRHVPVEDERHRLLGLVTYRSLLRHMCRRAKGEDAGPVPVSDVMIRDVVTVTPESRTIEAIRLMQGHGIGCLPVVQDGRLVGIVSERDFFDVAGAFLEREAATETS